MKKLAFVLMVAALAVLASWSGGVRAADNSVTVQLGALNNSGENGTATITQVGDNDVRVVVNVSNGTAEAQPAHIHKGSCANLDPTPAYPLNNVVNGKSDTTVMVGWNELAKGGYAINIHKSGTDLATYTSCGNIEGMSMSSGATAGGAMAGGSSMPATGAGDQPALLLGLALLALGLAGVGARLARARV
jgi:hypothetical protein